MNVQMHEAATQWVVFLLSFGVGAFIFGYGMYVRLGYTKGYFLKKESRFFGVTTYQFLPLVGAIFFVLALTALPDDVETRQRRLLYLLVPSFIVAFLIGRSQPWWLKPKWLRQLQDNHPDVFPFLREVAQEEIGDDSDRAQEWAQKMDTVQGQNEWLAQVRKRKGWQRRELYGAERPSIKVPRRFRQQITRLQGLPPSSKGLEEQIEIYEEILGQLRWQDAPPFWAAVQNKLGIAYSERRRGSGAENLEKAISAYEAALEVTTRDKFPVDWAMAQNNLGAAYRRRKRDDHAENLEKAVAAYESALEVLTRDRFPLHWAGTQRSLGFAYFKRIRGERSENLDRAIAAYRGALEVYSEEEFPKQRAAVEKGLEKACRARAEE